MKHGDELLGHLGSLKPKEVFFRTHSLLVTGDGTPALKWGSTNAYTEDQPYFAGFRSLATNGIDKPVLNVFRMFSKMDGQRLPVSSDAAVSLPDLLRSGVRGKPDVSAMAAMNGKKLTVLVWHYHDDDVRGPDAEVRIDLLGAPKGVPKVTRHLVDETHSNSFTAWLAMGSPQQPTAEQEQACKLAPVDEQARFIEEENLSAVMVTLARQGVTLLEMMWE
jgi:xylan 1,4-beta-xylosidase